jgi:hypothetical protein
VFFALIGERQRFMYRIVLGNLDEGLAAGFGVLAQVIEAGKGITLA